MTKPIPLPDCPSCDSTKTLQVIGCFGDTRVAYCSACSKECLIDDAGRIVKKNLWNASREQC